MNPLAGWARKLLGFFVADAVLTVFVPVWMAIAWLCKHELPGAPASLLAVFTAGGPIFALWWSVRRASLAFRHAARNPQ